MSCGQSVEEFVTYARAKATVGVKICIDTPISSWPACFSKEATILCNLTIASASDRMDSRNGIGAEQIIYDANALMLSSIPLFSWCYNDDDEKNAKLKREIKLTQCHWMRNKW